MTRVPTARLVLACAAALILLAGASLPAIAQEDALVLPAGVACTFPLKIVQDTADGGPQNQHELLDKDGNVRAIIVAGRGYPLTYTNLDTGKTMATSANGAVQRTTPNPDGTTTFVAMGHNVIILFPTDVPAGPSTTLHVGRVVVTIDGDGVWTLDRTSGTSLDICAALSD